MVEKSRYLRKGWGKKYDKNDLAEHTSFENGNGTLTTNVLFYCLRNIKVLLPGSISAALSLDMPSVSAPSQTAWFSTVYVPHCLPQFTAWT